MNVQLHKVIGDAKTEDVEKSSGVVAQGMGVNIILLRNWLCV